MRLYIFIGALVGALVTSRAAAQSAPPEGGQRSDAHPAEQENGKDIKGYGYGEQPGKSDTAAKQETGAARPKSKTPQDEQRSTATGRSSGSATGAGARSLSGRIVKVSPKSLSLRAGGSIHRIRLDENTRVLREGTEVSVRDLQAGEEVRAAFDTRGGRRVATTITLVEKGAREPPSHTDKSRESELRQDGKQPGQER